MVQGEALLRGADGLRQLWAGGVHVLVRQERALHRPHPHRRHGPAQRRPGHDPRGLWPGEEASKA